MTCAGCGADLGRRAQVGRRDTCPTCGADLRACRNCRFHAPELANECREPQAERVTDRVRANFCEYFTVVETSAPAAAPPRRAGDDAGDARAALDRLFRRT